MPDSELETQANTVRERKNEMKKRNQYASQTMNA